MEVYNIITYVSSMDTAYVRESPTPLEIALSGTVPPN